MDLQHVFTHLFSTSTGQVVNLEKKRRTRTFSFFAVIIFFYIVLKFKIHQSLKLCHRSSHLQDTWLGLTVIPQIEGFSEWFRCKRSSSFKYEIHLEINAKALSVKNVSS